MNYEPKIFTKMSKKERDKVLSDKEIQDLLNNGYLSSDDDEEPENEVLTSGMYQFDS